MPLSSKIRDDLLDGFDVSNVDDIDGKILRVSSYENNGMARLVVTAEDFKNVISQIALAAIEDDSVDIVSAELIQDASDLLGIAKGATYETVVGLGLEQVMCFLEEFGVEGILDVGDQRSHEARTAGSQVGGV